MAVEIISAISREDVERKINKYLGLDFEPYGDLISSRAVRYRKEMAHPYYFNAKTLKIIADE